MVTPSRIFLSTCVAVLAGIALALALSVERFVIIVVAILGVVFIIFGTPRRAAFGSRAYLPLALGCVLLGAMIGIWRVEQFNNALREQTVDTFTGQAMVEGVVSSYPKETLRDIRFTLSVKSVNGEPARGNVAAALPLNDLPSYGDVLEVKGMFRAPERFNGFNYPAYLAKDSITATLSGSEFKVVGREGNPLKRYLFNARASVEKVTVSILPFREAATLKALLLGDEGFMTKDFQDDLNRSGLRHIVAISGMNISIITSMLMGLGLAVGLWKKQSFVLAVGAVFLFVAMIGAPASAVRAALMGAALYVAPIVGRPAGALRAVVFSAVVMTLVSPYIVFYDVGFQLSFIAVLGMLYLEPILKSIFTRLPRIILDPLATTLAAQLAVFPLLISTFDYVSLVSPISNILVVTPLPLVTIAGFVAVGAGIIWLPTGILLSVFLFPYLIYLQHIATFFARFPVATIALPATVVVLGALCWYGLLAYWILNEQKKHPRPIDLI